MDLKYKHVEAALVDVVGVKPKAIGAFRGRLRHLRKLGLPQLQASGSGKHLIYTQRQALEMLVAIQLEKLGHKPENAARLSLSIVRQSPFGQHEGKNCYIVPDPPTEDSERYRMMFGADHVCEFLKSSPEVFTLVNVSALIRKLNVALDRALKLA